MSRTEDFLKCEKDRYGKAYVDISYAISNISPFLDEPILKRRKYVAKLDSLKKYMDAIDAAEREIGKSGFLGIFSSDKYIDLLTEYKTDNNEALTQLEKCTGCACLNCTANCKFNSCLGCRRNSSIVQCDHKTINITKHDSFYLELTNNNTGETDQYFALATMQDVDKDKKYIIIQATKSEEKFILYYNPGISEDTYGEISNPEEFDHIASTYQSLEE